MLKLFGTIYTGLSTQQLTNNVCLKNWQIEEVEENGFSITGSGVKISIEGSGDVLIFGELDISLAQIDDWIALISTLPVSYNIDIHADEARLIRRYQQ
jgi:hypothetical protein